MSAVPRSNAQEKSDPAPVTSAVAAIPSFATPKPGDLRSRMFAPARIAIHEGARVGDWLERARVGKKLTFRERTTIAARQGELWIVDRTGPAWAGNALRLFCAADGKVLAAAAGKPGGDLVGVNVVREEPSEAKDDPEAIETPAGKMRARKSVFRIGGAIPDETTRFVAVEGLLAGIEVRRESVRAGHRAVLVLAQVEDASLVVGGEARPCLRLLRTLERDGAAAGGVEEWLAKTPVFFGERLLRRLEGDVDEKVELGRDGAPVFPVTAPR